MLTSAIIQLLYRSDCVIVPGLGAFLTRRVASCFDEQRGLMLPPRKEVAFNPDLRHTDGVLADFLVSCGEASDYEAAQSQIEEFTSGINRKLMSGNVVMLPELGSLSITDGRITFEPAAGFNALVDSYGLAPVAAERVKPSVMDTFGRVDIRKAVASAAAVAAFLLVSPQTADTDLNRADLTQPFLNSLTQSVEAQQPAEQPEATIEPDEMMEPDTKVDSYCIVVASFISRQEAQDYIASMRARGVSGLSILEYGDRARVIAAQFTGHDEAVSANHDIRALQGFEKAWVLHVTQ